jgi:hypothetical protein
MLLCVSAHGECSAVLQLRVRLVAFVVRNVSLHVKLAGGARRDRRLFLRIADPTLIYSYCSLEPHSTQTSTRLSPFLIIERKVLRAVRLDERGARAGAVLRLVDGKERGLGGGGCGAGVRRKYTWW